MRAAAYRLPASLPASLLASLLGAALLSLSCGVARASEEIMAEIAGTIPEIPAATPATAPIPGSAASTVEAPTPRLEDCGLFAAGTRKERLESPLVALSLICEAISTRHRADMPLGDRLAAAEATLLAYDAEVQRLIGLYTASEQVAARFGARIEDRIALVIPATRLSVAETTGALLAVEALQDGY